MQNVAQLMAAIVPPKRDVPRCNAPSDEERTEAFGAADMRALEQPQPMSKLVNLGLCDLMLSHPEIVMAGEDIGRKCGV